VSAAAVRTLAASVVCLVVGLGAAAPGLAQAAEAGISGTVTASATHEPVPEVEVIVYNSEGGYVTATETAPNGTYTVSGLPEAEYKVGFVPESANYLTQYYNDKSSLGAASTVAVKTGVTTTGINAQLVAGGEIEGTVTGPNEEALSEVEVEVYNLAHHLVGVAQTSFAGTYTVSDLPTGSYVVEFVPGFGETNDASQYYSGTYVFADANHVTVNAGHPTRPINATLAFSGGIQGTVTDASTTAPLEGVEVHIYDSTEPDTYVAPVLTEASGLYTATGLPPGNYIVEFVPAGSYSVQYYEDKSIRSEATEVEVVAGEVEREKNAALTAGGRISGTVTSAATSAALEEVEVSVFNSSGEVVGSAQTGAEGKYTVMGLETGNYAVEFVASSGSYGPQFYEDKSTLIEAKKVAVTAPDTTTEINAALAAEGSIEGTVKAASNSAGLGGIEVLVYDSAEELITSTETEPNGTYKVPGLAGANYVVEFASPSGEYVSQYYNGKAKFSEATKVLVSAGAPHQAVNASMAAADGSLSGKVTGAASGNPVANVAVKVYESGAGHVASATSAANGTYTVSGLAPGSYEIEFVPSSAAYLTQYYGGAASLEASTPVTVTKGATTAGINAALKAPGEITGTVTSAATKAALKGVEVEVYGAHGELVTFADSAENGTYTVADLPTGSYGVEFVPASGYLGQYYKGASSPEEATQVPVTAGVDTSAINAALSTAGAISGKVTSASAPGGVANVEVQVYDTGGELAASAQTAANGTYTVSGLASSGYAVEFVPSSGTYARQFYAGASSPTEATLVSVVEGATTPSVNAELSVSGEISGTVISAATDAGLGAVEVQVYDSSGDSIASAETAANGTYTVSGLPAGTYAVEFSPTSGDYLPQFYSQKSTLASASKVTVTAGATKTQINAALAAGAVISGTVDKPGGTVPAPDVEVAAYNSTELVASATTAANGTYSLEGLPSGSYTVKFTALESAYPAGEYAPQYYSGASLPAEATAVAVTAGSTKSGINDTLAAPGAIAGKVTDAATTGAVAGVVVKVYDLEDNYVASAETAVNGTYTIPGLAAGGYEVEFVLSPTYLPQYYHATHNVALLTEAGAVSVKDGATTSAINGALLKPGAIAGKVTSASAPSGLANVEVQAYASGGELAGSAQTAANGTYTVSGLAVGSYRVGFFASTANLAPQYYNDKRLLSEATEVPVTAGNTASSINAALVEGGKIKGTVTDANTHASLANIEVVAYETERNPVANTETAANGTYTLSGLATGHYEVEFSAPSGKYLTQFNGAKALLSQASPFSVTAGSTTEPINAAMVPAFGALSGTVTNASSHAAIEHVEVKVYDSGDSYVASTETGEGGAYTVSGVPPGEYEVEFVPSSGNYLKQYSQDKSTLAEATKVAVTAGATKTGVNAALVVGGGISGTVTGASNHAPLANVLATVYNASDAPVAKAETAANGQYTVAGLAPGHYEVGFAGGGSYVPQFYKEGNLLVGATAVTVAAGPPTEQINGSLVLGGSISGTVTNALTGLPMAEVEVNVYNSVGTLVESEGAETASEGTYTVAALAPGSYEVQFVAPSEFFLGQFFSGASSLVGATQVSVKEGLPTEGINAAIVAATTKTTTSTSATATATVTTSSATTSTTATPTLSLAGAITGTPSAVLVPLDCSAGSGSCAPAVVKVTIVETLSKGRIVAVAAKHSSKPTKRTVVVGMLTATLSAGEKKTVSVTLNGTAKKLLALRKKLAVEVQVVSGGETLKTQVILIKPAKPKPKPKKKHS
jgi:hypothetical protein